MNTKLLIFAGPLSRVAASDPALRVADCHWFAARCLSKLARHDDQVWGGNDDGEKIRSVHWLTANLFLTMWKAGLERIVAMKQPQLRGSFTGGDFMVANYHRRFQ